MKRERTEEGSLSLLNDLPDEILSLVFSHVHVLDLYAFSLAGKCAHEIARKPHVTEHFTWRVTSSNFHLLKSIGYIRNLVTHQSTIISALGFLGYNLVEITLQVEHNETFQAGVMPLSLKKLTTEAMSPNQVLNSDTLPPSLQELIVDSNDFNSPINDLPRSLTKLDLSECLSFNQPVNVMLPNLKHLYLSVAFDKCIDAIPDSIETLQICDEDGESVFSKPIAKFPSNVKSLTLGKYDHDGNDLIKMLPSSLRVLIVYDDEFAQHCVVDMAKFTHLTILTVYSEGITLTNVSKNIKRVNVPNGGEIEFVEL